MMFFALTVLLALALASALLVIPAMRAESNKPVTTRDALNKAIYQDRLSELTEEEMQGVVTQRSELMKELQQNLLSDIPAQEVPQPPSYQPPSYQRQAKEVHPINRWALLPGVMLLLVVAGGLYLKTGGLAQVWAWQDIVAQLPELRARMVNEHAEPLTLEDVADLGLGLRTALQQDASNVNDWMILGRVGVVLNNITMATQAFAKAYQLAPDNKEVKLGYVEVLSLSNDPQDKQTAIQILQTSAGQPSIR